MLCDSEPIQWYISQTKGSPYLDATDGSCESFTQRRLHIFLLGDNFTCLEFNDTGELLAVGDKGGHVTVFKANDEGDGVYDVYCAFTSHEPEFDYLKSLEIEEKINSINWLPNVTAAHHLLSANDKTIKLWRLSERRREAYNFNTRDDDGSESLWNADQSNSSTIGPPVPTLRSATQLRIPRFRPTPHLTVESRPRRMYANAHMYHINAISLNCDQETFLSADDLRINLWHLDVSNQSFTIVDLKPPNMEDLSEVITCARFHPSQCHLLAYSTSRGFIRLCDMRIRALCDNHVLAFEDPRLSHSLGFFADIIASLSDFRFAHSGQYVLARDYLSLKVWDIRMGDRPCELYSIHEPFRSQLCMLYENDAIFDKFLCSWSSDDRYVSTGSYGNLFRIFDRHTGSDRLYDLNTENDSGLSPDPVTTIPLVPKHFVSPEDPLGSTLGVSTVCVTSVDAIESLMGDIEHSGMSSGSDIASPSGVSESANEFDSLDGSFESVDKDAGCLEPLSELAASRASVDQPDTSVNLPTGSKRRKQTLFERTSESELLQPPDPICKSPRHHRRKQKFDRPEDRNLTVPISQNNLDTNSNGCPDREPKVIDSSALLNERIRTRLERHRLFGERLSDKAMSLSDLRQLDCQRKVLHVAWHPRLRKLATVSGNQLFIVRGVEPPTTILDRPAEASDCRTFSTEDDVELQAEPVINGYLEASGDMLPSDGLPTAKRRRRRGHYRTNPSHSSSPDHPSKDSVESSSDLTPRQDTLDPFAVSVSLQADSIAPFDQPDRVLGSAVNQDLSCTNNPSHSPLVHSTTEQTFG
ncbi:protein phosphatase 2 (formerly 2A) regulatory subunit B [Clonorchis sinensis]|uniref:Serine/threonine-protein phosphatase 2A 55 kDa regulatory subunit B n=1 Tax=Clonorchis sinensis TaxID=79923 RepID=H2KPH3_CLOSI|nr:protein phosphatase 2 (formerly 2A) regulatory subunit B [Clonorchis sinensis]